MNKIIHTKTLKLLAAALPAFAILLYSGVAFADSVKYSTPYSENATGYQLDGGVTVNVNVAEINALEMALSTNNLIIDLAPHIGSPSFDTDTLNILVGTTNATGYTLTMASSYDGAETTSLTRTESISGTNPTIDTIENSLTPTDFASSSNTSSINKWGYLLSATNLDIDKTFYNPILTTNTINSSTEPVYNDPTSITFGAKVNSELPAGNYRATLKFTAVANPAIYNYNIRFNSNGGTIANSPVIGANNAGFDISLPSAGTYHNAYATNTGTSYATFAGWSETPNANVATYTDSFTLNGDTDINLYAVWNFNDGTLQNPSSVCGNNMVDARTGIDYPTYANGDDCWMSKNLYLAIDYALFPGDSNIISAWSTPTTDLDGTANSYDTAKIHVGEYDTNMSPGTWYNYCAATAGTVCDDETAQNSSKYDICPKGWGLPTYAQASLLSDSQQTSQWNAINSGLCYDFADSGVAQCSGIGDEYGLWWTSNAGDNIAHRSFLRYTEGTELFNMMNDGNRAAGYSIRCVRK